MRCRYGTPQSRGDPSLQRCHPESPLGVKDLHLPLHLIAFSFSPLGAPRAVFARGVLEFALPSSAHCLCFASSGHDFSRAVNTRNSEGFSC
jgi:hypothetical protein